MTAAIEILKRHVEWGMEVNRNQLFNFANIRDMIEEAEKREKEGY